MQSVLWSTSDLAQFLGLCPDTIYRRRAYYPDSVPPALKIGNRLYWIPSKVMEWCEARKG
jgi:predicted DNA-binding transcriptional regulator AlpA